MVQENRVYLITEEIMSYWHNRVAVAIQNNSNNNLNRIMWEYT